MIKMLWSKKAQNLTEFALLISIVIMAFIGMEIYFRRGLQSKIRTMTDNYMTSGVLGGGNLTGSAKQAVYSIDTHNYVVIDSDTSTNSTSRSGVNTSAGGGKVETSKIDVNVPASTSHSEVVY